MTSKDTDIETALLQKKLEKLKNEHHILDQRIRLLIDNGVIDQVKIARLKKEKLRLKDQITRIENWLTPDVIA